MGAARGLKAYDHVQALAVGCMRAAKKFPPEEQNRLADQLRRAVQSAVLNLAEGAGRLSLLDWRKFLDVVRTSLDEVEAIFDLGEPLGYFDPDELALLRSQQTEAAKTVYGLLRSVSARCGRPSRRKQGPLLPTDT